MKAPALHFMQCTAQHTPLTILLHNLHAYLSGLGGGITRLQPVTTKAPALRFMQQLDVPCIICSTSSPYNPIFRAQDMLCNAHTLLLRLHADLSGLGGGVTRLQPVTIKGPALLLHALICTTHTPTFPISQLHADLSGLGGGVTRLQPVTIKAPALRFMQQLDVLLQKIFPKIRDRVQRRIMPMLVGGRIMDVVLLNVSCTLWL
jgi:hypothetical protein